MRARCPRCARPCEQFYTPMPGEWFACDNCERGDGVDSVRGIAVALGPLVFTREEADEAQAVRREAKAAWDKAVAAHRKCEAQTVDAPNFVEIAESADADHAWYGLSGLPTGPFGAGLGC